MKIGILTFHRSHNYGALLQAIALRKVLLNMGHKVSYVDYYPEYDRQCYTVFNVGMYKTKRTIRKRLGYIYRSLIKGSVLGKWLRIKNFIRFRNTYLEPYFVSTDEQQDVVIYGSDQLWRIQPIINDYDPVYFGANDFNTQRHISYAVSLALLPENEEIEKFNKLVKHQDKISVRETQLRDYLVENGFEDVSVCLDPTLLIDSKEWNEMIPCKRIVQEKYILVFDLQKNEGVTVFGPEYLKELSEKYGCKIVYLHGEAQKLPTKYDFQTAAPDVFLNLIRYAECVLTSSFHGTVFSIIYKKLFYNAQTYGTVRSKSILKQLDLMDRFLNPDETIGDLYKAIDYSDIDEKLSNMRLTSLNYLENL